MIYYIIALYYKMGADMKDFCNNLENFERSMEQFSRFIKGQEDTKRTLSLHIEKLVRFSDSLKNKDDKRLILDSIILFSEELNCLRELSDAVQEIDNYLKMMSQQSEIDNRLSLERASGVKILEAQEQVRKQIATELHDSAVQSLTGLTYKTDLCIKLLERDPTRVRLELQVMLSLLKDIIKDMRNTIYNLRPTMLGDRSLDNCICTFLKNLGIMYPNVSFMYEAKGNVKQVREVFGITVLQIIQEACQNAAKHSNSQYIKVEVHYLPKSLLLKIEDNGIGFEHNQVESEEEKCEHFGLSIMQERAQLMNTHLNIESSKDKGTVISVEIPEVYSNEGDNNDSD